MELICKIRLSPRYESEENSRCFWGSVIIGNKYEELSGPPKDAILYHRSLVGDEHGEIIQRYASVKSLEIQFSSQNILILHSFESFLEISIRYVPPGQLKAFTNYLKKLMIEDSPQLQIPPVSEVSTSLFQLPLSLVNVNGDEEYSTKVELAKEDLEHVISLNIKNCSLTTPIGSEKLKNLRSLCLQNSVIHNNDVFQVESGDLKELYVWKCELQFEITSLFQNKLNFIDSLTELYLERSQLSQVPDAVFQFRNLIKLSLNHNCITQLPNKLFKLPKLKELWVSHNQLQYLPCSLLSLKLRDLDITCNNFVFDDFISVTCTETNVHSLKELSYRTILNNKLVMKEEKLPKSLRESLANHHQCLCGTKFMDEGQPVSFLLDIQGISISFSYTSHNYETSFPIRGGVCSSLPLCWFRRFEHFPISTPLWEWWHY